MPFKFYGAGKQPYLNPLQNAHEYDQQDQVKSEDGRDRNGLGPDGLQVIDPIGDQEKVEIAAEPDQPGGLRTPPGIVPGQGAEIVKNDLDDNGERREQNDEEPAVGEADDLLIVLSCGRMMEQARPMRRNIMVISMLRPMRMM